MPDLLSTLRKMIGKKAVGLLPGLAYSELTGIPATFPPSAHTHPESDITNLTSDLGTLATAITSEASARGSADTTLTSALNSHTGNTSNPHSVTKTQVSLGNVDNVQQMPLSYLDTDTALAANSDVKVASQKAAKTYSDLKAAKASNLSDLANAGTARTNLGLGTVATLASDTDGTLAANSDTRVATQKAIKTYADALPLATAAPSIVITTFSKGTVDFTTQGNLDWWMQNASGALVQEGTNIAGAASGSRKLYGAQLWEPQLRGLGTLAAAVNPQNFTFVNSDARGSTNGIGAVLANTTTVTAGLQNSVASPAAGGVGQGFLIRVLCDSLATRYLRIYAGGKNGGIRLTCHFSDQAIADVVDTTFSTNANADQECSWLVTFKPSRVGVVLSCFYEINVAGATSGSPSLVRYWGHTLGTA